MKAKAVTIEAGMAVLAMSVVRQSRMNKRIVEETRSAAITK